MKRKVTRATEALFHEALFHFTLGQVQRACVCANTACPCPAANPLQPGTVPCAQPPRDTAATPGAAPHAPQSKREMNRAVAAFSLRYQ